MTAKEYAKQTREKQRQEFGDVELKKDCKYYDVERGKAWCKVCNVDKERRCLPCVFSVCYFYDKKGEE